MKNNMNYVKVARTGLESIDLSFCVEEKNSRAIFSLPMPAKNFPNLMIQIEVSDNGDAKIWTYLARNIQKEQIIPMLYTLNDLNCQYRFICAYLDRDQDVAISYDFSLGNDEDTVKKLILTNLFLFQDIIENCIPSVMKLLWGGKRGNQTMESDFVVLNPFTMDAMTDSDSTTDTQN